MIDITLSDSQREIRVKAAKFASDVLITAADTYEKHPTQKERFQALRPFYGQAVKAGLVKGLIPKPFGGTAGTVVEAALLVEQLCKHDRSLSLTIFSTGLGLSSLLIAGSPEQREEHLKPFLSGEGEPLASLLHTEPEGIANWLEKGGSGLRTVAKKDGDDWVISGDKVGSNDSVAAICDVNIKLTSIDMGYKLLWMGRSWSRSHVRCMSVLPRWTAPGSRCEPCGLDHDSTGSPRGRRKE